MFVEHKEVGESVGLDEPAKILLRAADCIDRNGLAKYIQKDSKGRMCVAGAIVFASGGQPYEEDGAGGTGYPNDDAIEAKNRFCEAIGYGRGGDGVGPANWNNARERTQAEVVAKLRSVALGL